jgi:hypothetical protein
MYIYTDADIYIYVYTVYIYIYAKYVSTYHISVPLVSPAIIGQYIFPGHGESPVFLLPFGGFLSSRWGYAGGGGEWPWLSDAEPVGRMADIQREWMRMVRMTSRASENARVTKNDLEN